MTVEKEPVVGVPADAADQERTHIVTGLPQTDCQLTFQEKWHRICHNGESFHSKYTHRGYCARYAVCAVNAIFALFVINGIASILSVNSAGSLLSVNSIASIMSVNSVLSIGCAQGFMKICM